MTESQRQLCHDLKMEVIWQAQAAGALGSPEYQAAYSNGLAQLQTDQAQIRALVRSGNGKQVTSVSAGEQVTWSEPMSVLDQLGAYNCAIMNLMGMTYIQNRTTARFLY